jgi:hypothetical protein
MLQRYCARLIAPDVDWSGSCRGLKKNSRGRVPLPAGHDRHWRMPSGKKRDREAACAGRRGCAGWRRRSAAVPGGRGDFSRESSRHRATAIPLRFPPLCQQRDQTECSRQRHSARRLMTTPAPSLNGSSINEVIFIADGCQPRRLCGGRVYRHLIVHTRICSSCLGHFGWSAIPRCRSDQTHDTLKKAARKGCLKVLLERK